MFDQYLYVPMAIKGLMIGQCPSNAEYFGAFYDYTRLGDDVLGSKVNNAFLLKHCMEPGIHLLWSLPDGLTQAKEDEAQKNLVYPMLPDHWLVTRMWVEHDELHSKNWLIHSKAISKEEGAFNSGSHTIAWYNDEETPYRYRGAVESPDEKPDIEYADQLFAIESGDAVYTAYYPSAKNMFGFHDDMTNEAGRVIPNAAVAYCVCGYYSDHGADALCKITSPENCLEEFGWAAPEDTVFSGQRGTLCHGMLLNIPWEGKDKVYQSAVPTQRPSLHIGNTSAEALSAKASSPEAERMLNHLLAQNHRLTASPKAVHDAEKRLHAQRFSYAYGGFQFSLKPKQKSNDSMPGASQEPSNELLFVLEQLNASLRRLEALERQRCDQYQAVYDDWARTVFWDQKERTRANQERAKKYMGKTKEGFSKLDSLEDIIDDEKDEFSSAYKALDALLASSAFELSRVNDENYAAPNPIAMLLDKIDRDPTHGFDAVDGGLKARTAAINTFKMGNQTVPVGENALFSHRFPFDAAAPVRHLRALINESALFNDPFEAAIAKKLAASKASLPAENAAAPQGDCPAGIGISKYAPPWHPLYLVWECVFYPDSDTLHHEAHLGNWKKDGDDYALLNPDRMAKEGIALSGKTVITPQAALNMAGTLKQLYNDSCNAEDMMVLSQVLEDIDRKLMQKSMGPKIEPLDGRNGRYRLAEDLRTALKDFDFEPPDFYAPFCPLRAGLLKFTKVWVVDSFGQVQQIQPKDIVIAESLKMGGRADTIMLPPRIMQPARLHFQWLNLSSAAASPIYGFVTPNLLERSLMVFDEKGELLGRFQKTNLDGECVKWFEPYSAGGGSGKLPDPETMNADLYQFLHEINRLAGLKIDVLTPLLECISRALSGINPLNAAQLDPISLFFVRPLVLAKAEVRLETMQSPATYKVADEGEPPANDIDLKRVTFPIYVGQSSNHNDGTIGFFINGDYTSLRLTSALEKSTPPYLLSQSHVPFKPNDASTTLTFLADPIGEINLESLILPMTTVRIAPDLVAKALSSLYHTVAAAPVLITPSNIRLPVPDVEGKKWGYLSFTTDGLRETEPVLAPTEADNFEPTPLCADEGWLKLMKQEGSEP